MNKKNLVPLKNNIFSLQNEGHVFLYLLIYFLMMGLVIFIPFSRKAIPFFIASLTLIFLFFPCIKLKIKSLLHKKITLLFYILIYLTYIAGVFYSDNLSEARTDLILKLPLLLFPLFFTSFSGAYKYFHYRFILQLFALSAFTSSLFLVVRAIVLFYVSGNPGYFFYESFSLFFHPGYYGMYINFALALVLFELLQLDTTTKKKYAIVLSTLAFYFLGIILMVNSKAVFFSTAIIILLWLLQIVFVKKKYKLGLIFSSLIVIVIVLSIKLYPQTYNRLIIGFKNINPNREHTNRFDGSYMRLQIWECSSTIIKNNFWTGVGTGDVKDELVKKYIKNDLTLIVERNLNAHNQFLQTFIATGFFGFLALLIVIILPLIVHRKKSDFSVILYFTIIITVNFFAESMLETQAGLVFFSFFSAFFVFFNPNTKPE